MLGLLAALASCENWAVIYTGARSFVNYRHTADSYYQYYLLLKGGIKKENIILMNYDDVVDSSQNKFKGSIFRNLAHDPNVYPGKENIDYLAGKVTADSFYKVLKGDSTAEGPVLKSTKNDYVYIFFDDHGGDGILGVPEGCGPYIYAKDLKAVLETMQSTGMFKKCFFPVTACYAGSVATYFEDIPDLYVMTASGEAESSYASLYDSKVGAYLTSEFSLIKDQFYEENPEGTLTEMLKYCQAGVKMSHVKEYGDKSFKDMKVSTWIGALNTEEFRYAGRKAMMVASELEATKRSIEIKSMSRQLDSTERMQLLAEKTSSMMLDTIIGHLKGKFAANSNIDFTQPCKNQNWDGYKQVLGCLQAKVGRLGESFWGKTFFFSNLCTIADPVAIVAEIERLF